MIILRDTGIIIRGVDDVAAMLQRWLLTLDPIDQGKEHFIVIHLNTRVRILLAEVVSIGIVNASIVHPREVFRRAITENTVSLIIAHNHPSGNCDPSDEDVKITSRIQSAGEMIGIMLIDHVIFTGAKYFSFAASGMLLR